MREFDELGRVETASCEAEQWGRRALHELPAHVAVLDGEGIIVLVNRAWSDFAQENGAVAEARVAVGENYVDFCRRAADAGDGDAQAALAGLSSVLEGAARYFAREYPSHSPSEQRWFLMEVARLDAEVGVGAIVSHADITASKRAKQALLASETRFRALFDNAAVGMAEIAPNGRWVRVNATLLRIMARPLEELLAGTLLEFTHPEDIAADAAHIEVLRAAGADSCNIEKRFLRGDGSQIWVAMTLSCMRGDDGSVDYFIAIVEDISERRRAQQRQRNLMNELAHRGKNLLAVVQSLAHRSLVDGQPFAEARRAFFGRLKALSATYGALIDEAFNGAQLDGVLKNELTAFSARAQMNGPSIVLTVKAAETFGLVVHELATNALKYGALSAAEGQVQVVWEIVETLGGPQLHFDWRESGGPAAKEPARRGFGTALLSRIAGLEFNCEPQLDYRQEGFHYRFEAPLKSLGAALSISPVRRRLKGEILCAFYDAWSRQRGPDGRLPTLASFDWSKFAATGALTIAKIESGGKLHFVEVGRALIGELGRALEDRDIAGEDPASMAEVYRRCARKGEPCHEFLRFEFGDDEPLTFERLLTPFSATGGSSATHVVGISLYDGHTPPAGG